MISFNGLDMKLTITSASTEFSGTYKVVVSNEFGQDESSAKLVVKVRNSKQPKLIIVGTNTNVSSPY